MSQNELETKEKYKTLESLLEGDHIFIHVDSRQENISLPEDLMNKPNLTLKLSRNFRGAVELTREKITAELLFPEGYHSCSVALEAIWGVTDETGKNMIWPSSTPKEVLEDMVASAASEQEQEEPQPEKPVSVATNSDPKPSKEKKDRDKSYLKRVK